MVQYILNEERVVTLTLHIKHFELSSSLSSKAEAILLEDICIIQFVFVNLKRSEINYNINNHYILFK